MSLSRIETLLQAISNGEVIDVKPLSRVEEYLYLICKNGIGGGGAPSWEDLLNRPFYSELSERRSLVGTCNLSSIQNANTHYVASFSRTGDVTLIDATRSYIVNYNGSEYPCETVSETVVRTDGTFALGQTTINIISREVIIPKEGSNVPTGVLELYEIESIEEVHTMDEKYIPESIARNGSISWNGLLDRPFYDDTIPTVVFDGTVNPAVTFTPHGQRGLFVKITDEVFTAEQLNGATLYRNGDAREIGSIDEFDGGCRYSNQLISISENTVTLGLATDGASDTFPEIGTYVQIMNANTAYIELVFPSKRKQIDEKFLPSGPTTIDLSAFESEGKIVETFEDGTTKTSTIEFDAEGNPTKITDSDGNTVTITW